MIDCECDIVFISNITNVIQASVYTCVRNCVTGFVFKGLILMQVNIEK